MKSFYISESGDSFRSATRANEVAKSYSRDSPGETYTVRESETGGVSPGKIRGRFRNGKRVKNPSKRKTQKRVSKALTKYVRGQKNPAQVKGHKVKGGRAVSLRGFTGTVTRKSNGQVIIRGKARKR